MPARAPAHCLPPTGSLSLVSVPTKAFIDVLGPHAGLQAPGPHPFHLNHLKFLQVCWLTCCQSLSSLLLKNYLKRQGVLRCCHVLLSNLKLWHVTLSLLFFCWYTMMTQKTSLQGFTLRNSGNGKGGSHVPTLGFASPHPTLKAQPTA